MEMIPYVETDLDRFVRAVMEDLGSAGALADYADEHDPPTAPYISGRPSPSRGVLLRRRWEKWKRERVQHEDNARIGANAHFWGLLARHDAGFRLYVWRHFGTRWATGRDFF